MNMDLMQEVSSNTDFESFLARGRILGKQLNKNTGAIADYGFYGKHTYAKRYDEVAKAVGVEIKTLQNNASVASRFPLSRRRENLSFSHHEVVAALPIGIQDNLLDQAEENGGGRNELREAVKALRPEKDVENVFKTLRLTFLEDEYQELEQRAEEAEMSVEDGAKKLLQNEVANVCV